MHGATCHVHSGWRLIGRYNSSSSDREPYLQYSFISAVDRSRMITQRNKGEALDYHFAEYSQHYNLCKQFASQIKESLASVNSAGYLHLQQQFNVQFNPASQFSIQYNTVSHNEAPSFPERPSHPVERLRDAMEPLRRDEYSVPEAASDGMESIDAGSSDWETVCSSSEDDGVSFDSIPVSTESGAPCEAI